jgi:hypothetical protein
MPASFFISSEILIILYFLTARGTFYILKELRSHAELVLAPYHQRSMACVAVLAYERYSAAERVLDI